MELDGATLELAATAVLGCGAGYLVSDAHRRQAVSSDLPWWGGLVAASGATLTAALTVSQPRVGWADAVAWLLLTLAVGLLWCGARAMTGKTWRVWVVVLSTTVGAALVVAGLGTRLWALVGAVIAAQCAVWAVLASRELARSMLMRRVGGVVSAGVLGLLAILAVAEIVPAVVAGAAPALPFASLGSPVGPGTALVAATLLTLAVVEVRTASPRLREPFQFDPRYGVRTHAALVHQGEHVLAAARAQRRPCAVVVVAAADQREIQLAYGMPVLDAVNALVAETLRAAAPPGSLIGLDARPGRFLVVLVGTNAQAARLWADGVHRLARETRVRAGAAGVRLVLETGVAVGPSSMTELAEQASADLERIADR